MRVEDHVAKVDENEIRQACAELDRRLRGGEACCAEDFLKSDPNWFGDIEAALELIYTEFVIRTELAQEPDPTTWYVRFPQWQERLQRLFEIHNQMGAVAARSTLTGLATPIPAHAEQSAALRSGTANRLNSYELLEKIGHGGMGVVYKARQMGLDRIVALKMILAGAHAGAEELARFLAEGEAAARLQHPNIVQIHEVGERDGLPFFSLEFVEGGSLAKQRDGKPLPPTKAAQLVSTLAGAIHFAHQRGIIHRDLKPANILLAADGTPKIADFGLAKRLQPGAGQTQTGAVVGTPSYMAPEQAEGQTTAISAATDVYGLGATFYELLTGRPPFQGPSPLDTLAQVRSVEPVPPTRLQPTLPCDLETICLKCLRKEPAQRYGSAKALADDLHRFLAGEPIQARPAGVGERLWKWTRRRPAVAGLLAALLSLIVAAFSVVTVLWLQTADALEDTESARAGEAAQRAKAEANLYDKQLLLARREWENHRFEQAKKTLAECDPARRDREWHYLHRALHSQLWRQEIGLFAAFDASGRRMAVLGNVGDQSGIMVLDTATGQQLFFCAGVFYQVEFNSQKNQLVTFGHWRGSFANGQPPLPPPGVAVCDLKTGDKVGGFLWEPKRAVAAHISPRGDLLAIVDTPNGTKPTMVWKDPCDGRVLHDVGPISSLAHTESRSNGKRLVTLDSNHTKVTIWDMASGKITRTLFLGALFPPEQRGPSTHVAIDADGERVAVGYNIGNADELIRAYVKVYDIDSGEERLTFQAHANRLHDLAFCPSGQCLATLSEDRTIVIWDLRTGKEQLTFRVDSKRLRRVAFSPDGLHLVATEPKLVLVWDARPLRE